MNFHQHEGSGSQPMAEINMVPMIDIMLVLLIIFIITAPLLTHSVKMALPQASSQLNQVRPQSIMLSLDAQGHYYCNGVRYSHDALVAHLSKFTNQPEPPPVQLYVDRQLSYGLLASLLAELSNMGLHQVAFVTEPESGRS